MSRSANLAEHDFEDDVAYRALDYTGLDLTGRTVESMEIDQCRFTDTRLAAVTMVKSLFTETVFDNCDLANINARVTSLVDSTVTNSRLTGSKWAECVFRGTTFKECRLDLTSFRFATFKQTVFRSCNLREADFHNADLRRIRFESCDLQGAQFTDAQLAEAKFIDCNLLGIGGVTSFRGAVVDSDDLGSLAYSLAAALGIRISSRG
ncbi:pentapeptide repeat-containing protein [Kibdelosporangium aridum]|nr:pentapeptide repeat-containing protein [Kibdelosporangium aridum]